MATTRYQATGPEAEFEPGSRGRVLRNLLRITRVRDMNLAESQALEIAQDMALERFDADHRFTARDVCELHAMWLGAIYPWAGEYRSVDIGKGGFQFAHARLIPGLMAGLERGVLRRHTPCRPAAFGLQPDVGARKTHLHSRHPCGDGAQLSALGDRVRENYRADALARCCQ